MEEVLIDMQKLRDTMPKGGAIILRHNTKPPTSIYLYCEVANFAKRFPITWEKDFQMIKDWQRQILGDAFLEFYTHTEGARWTIYLKRVILTLNNVTDHDILTYTGFSKQQLTESKK